MLTAAEEQFHIENEPAPYAASPEEAAIKSAVATLKRFYPTVAVIHDDYTAKFILQRTMASMLHLDTEFSMQTTFDQEHYDRMVEEANIYMDWLNSDDDHWPPAGLEYRSLAVNETNEDDEEIPVASLNFSAAGALAGATVTTAEKAETRKPRSVSSNSRYQKGKAMFLEDVKSGRERAYTLKRMEQELDLNLATANVYYSKYKAECNIS